MVEVIRQWVWGVACVFVVGCTTSKPEQIVLTGRVTTDQAVPIYQATVTVTLEGVAQPFVTTTNALGNFHIANPSVPWPADANLVAYVTHPGYAPSAARLHYKLDSSADINAQLRPVDTTLTAELRPDQPVQISAQRLDGGAIVSIPPNSLVDSSGALATGTVHVELTYWHPFEPMSTQPAPLFGDEPNGKIPLFTYGMADISVTQNGQHLQVAPNHTIGLQLQIGSLEMAQIANQIIPMPYLWYMDPNTGYWTRQNGLLNNSLTYDPGAGVFTAALPHMSAWNVDGGLQPANGGCFTGKAVNACNPAQGLANTPVRVFFMGFEQVWNWNTTTDNSGEYCVSIGMNAYLLNQVGTNASTTYSIHYYASSTDPSVSNLCNPAPAYCVECPSVGAYGDCGLNCRLDDPAASNVVSQDGYVKPVPTYSDGCSPPSPTLALQACHFCPGDPATPASCTFPGNSTVMVGGCAQVETLAIPAAGCTCVSPGHTCKTSSDCCPGLSGQANACTNGVCSACSVVGEGTPCNPTSDTCCVEPGKTGTLVCADFLCVPATDPTP